MRKAHSLINILTLAVAVFAFVFQIFPPENQADKLKSTVLFLGIIIYILVFFFAVQIKDRVKEYVEKIEKNQKDIVTIKEDLKIQKKIADVDKRLAIMEQLSRNRKGKFEVDTTWIFFAILIVLFIIYLQSLGLIRFGG